MPLQPDRVIYVLHAATDQRADVTLEVGRGLYMLRYDGMMVTFTGEVARRLEGVLRELFGAEQEAQA